MKHVKGFEEIHQFKIQQMNTNTPKSNMMSRVPKTKEQYEAEFGHSVVRMQKMLNQISFPMRNDCDNPTLSSLKKINRR